MLKDFIGAEMIRLADAVIARVNYELDIVVHTDHFYALAFKQDRVDEALLNQNIYTNHVQGGY